MQMDIADSIPILILHIPQRNIPQNARIIDQNIHSPKVVDSRLNNLVAIEHGIIIRECNATRFRQFGYDLVGDGSPSFIALRIEGAAEVIDDDFGPSGGEETGVCPTKAGSGAGDDGYLALVAEFGRHVVQQSRLSSLHIIMYDGMVIYSSLRDASEIQGQGLLQVRPLLLQKVGFKPAL
jgi:hypothetical protein